MASDDFGAALTAADIGSPQLVSLLARYFELKSENARLRAERDYLEKRVSDEESRLSHV